MAEIKKQPAAEYHADHSAWSRSMLSVFMESKREAELRFIKGEGPEDEVKPCMKLGSLTHAMLFEPDTCNDRFAMIPDELLAKNGAMSTKRAKEFEEANQDKTVVKSWDIKEAKRIVSNVRRAAGEWLNLATHMEQSVYWTDEETGVRLKARPDWLIVKPEMVLIFDLKTTTRIIPHTFAKVVQSHGYWFQAAHYTQGVRALYPDKDVQFYFVGIEQGWPYRAGVFTLEDAAELKSFVTWRSTVNALAKSLESNDWSDPWEQGINVIRLKDWVFGETT